MQANNKQNCNSTKTKTKTKIKTDKPLVTYFYPAKLIFFVILNLFLVNYFTEKFNLQAFLKNTDILSDVRPDKPNVSINNNSQDKNNSSSLINNNSDQIDLTNTQIANTLEDKNSEKPVNQDNKDNKNNQEAKIIKQDIKQDIKNNSKQEKQEYFQFGFFEDFSENMSNLNNFFKALCYLENNNIAATRIAYLGDSSIEGDLITDELRNLLQEEFGGNGIGFLPITSVDANFKVLTKQQLSGKWTSYSIKDNGNKQYYSIGGTLFYPTPNSSVTYTFHKPNNGVEFAKLFYNNVNKSYTIKYVINKDKEEYFASLEQGASLQELIIKPKNLINSIKISFPASDISVYGVSLDDDKGIYVDNFAIRGHSGLGILKINKDFLKEFKNRLNYSVIALQFGLNIMNSTLDNFGWYEKDMIKVINLLKESFPESCILLIGIGDRSVNIKGKYLTSPNIAKLINAQKNIARLTKISFFNLFDAMGGDNSMVKWVKNGFASTDYTHFNRKGGNEVAKIIYQNIIQMYHAYYIKQHEFIGN